VNTLFAWATLTSRVNPIEIQKVSHLDGALCETDLWRGLAPSQVLETQQHRQHPFELAVEMDLVAAQPL
jgi:hypothetical protein